MRYMINGVHYNIETSGSGQAIILLHGFTGSTHTWDHLKENLKNEYKVITIDFLGHGKSDSPTNYERYSMENTVADLIQIIDHLNLTDKSHLLGYSMGGRLAIALACLYPELFRSLIIESSSPGLKSREDRCLRKKNDFILAEKIEAEGIDWFVQYWENTPLFQSQKLISQVEIEKQKALRLKNNPCGLANSLKGFGTGVQPSYWGQLTKLTFPVLLLTGEIDQKYCNIANEMVRVLPNVKHFTFSNAGHAIHVEQPDFFGKIVMEWLKINLH